MLRNGIVSLFECSFIIINHQPPPRVGFVDILDSCVWQTHVYSEIYFNDSGKSDLANDILKRVIVNGLTGSSWRFKKFDRICITINSNQESGTGK